MSQIVIDDQVAKSDLLHGELQRFYSRQMHALDAGETEAWAATFTDDGTFVTNTGPQVTRGRNALAAAAADTHRELSNREVVRRHWLGMLSVEQRQTGHVYARCYALVVSTPKGGKPELAFSTLCEDILIREGGTWLVCERTVTRDDI